LRILRTSYNIPITLLGLAAAGVAAGEGWTVAAVPFGLLGILLTFQATVVRFVFAEEGLQVCKKGGGELKVVREWKYDAITNWEVWWPQFPVLCYFKVSLTPADIHQLLVR